MGLVLALWVAVVVNLLEFRVRSRSRPSKLVSVNIMVSFLGLSIFQFGTFISLDLLDGALIRPARLGVILSSPMKVAYVAADVASNLTLNDRWSTSRRALPVRRRKLFIVHKYELLG